MSFLPLWEKTSPTASLPEGGAGGNLPAMLNVRFLILLSLGAMGLAGVLRAESFSTGQVEWQMDRKGSISLPTHGLKLALELQVGRGKSADGGLSDSQESDAADAPGEKRYASDRTFTMLGIDDEKKGSHRVTRSLKFSRADQEGVRVLDILKDLAPESGGQMILRYRTTFEKSAVETARPLSAPTGEKGALALLLIPKSDKQPALLLTMGGLDEGWTRKMDAGEDYVEWTYTGPAKKDSEVCLLHTLSICAKTEPAELEAAVEKLMVKGMPADSSLSEEVRQSLVNYPVAIKKVVLSADGKPSERLLVLLEQTLKAMNWNRPLGEDLLQLDGGEQIPGTFHGEVIRLGGQELKAEQIAAILGGKGTREARVFLRDGRVLRGRLEWKSAKFECESLGKVSLSADAPGVIVMRRNEMDGMMEPPPVGWMADALDGQVLPMQTLPERALNFRWLGGRIGAAWEEVVSLRALPAPALEHELVLQDGTRLRGWLEAGDSAVPVMFWARDLTGLRQLMEADAAGAFPKAEPPAVLLQDGSVITGEMSGGILHWRGQGEEMEIKVADLVRIERESAADAQTALLWVALLKDGTKIKGSPKEGALVWSRGTETTRLPWPWIQGVAFQTQQAAK